MTKGLKLFSTLRNFKHRKVKYKDLKKGDVVILNKAPYYSDYHLFSPVGKNDKIIILSLDDYGWTTGVSVTEGRKPCLVSFHFTDGVRIGNFSTPPKEIRVILDKYNEHNNKQLEAYYSLTNAIKNLEREGIQ